MQDYNPDKRVKKMVDAIKQEAIDKSIQIKEHAEQQFKIDKNRICILEKDKIQAQYEEKLEGYQIKKRIERSAKLNEQRLAKMETRHKLIIGLKDQVKESIKQQFNNAGTYKKFLKQLIVEGMVKLVEPKLEVRCLQKDMKVVQELKQECEAQYTEEIKKNCKGVNLACTLNIINAQFLDEKTCMGGVQLSCLDGKISCHNTVDNRIELVFQELLPQIRSGLFSK